MTKAWATERNGKGTHLARKGDDLSELSLLRSLRYTLLRRDRQFYLLASRAQAAEARQAKTRQI